jgi:hypothetical protein
MGGANTNLRLGACLHKSLPPCGGGYSWGVNRGIPPHPDLSPPNGKGFFGLQIGITLLASVGGLVAIGLLLLQGVAWAAEPVAVLTEIRMGQGEVQVKFVGEADWMAPQLLLALQPGDQLRAAGDGQAVVVFIGGHGAQTVSSANSPFTIQAPTGETSAENLRGVLASVMQFLLGQRREATYQPLTVRKTLQPPVILSPRESRLLPGPVTFEWAGSDRPRYSIRVLGPQGLLWEQADLPRQPISYPQAAPALRAGARYTWELAAKGYPVQRAQFELLPSAEAARIQAALALFEPGMLVSYPQNTLVLLRAGLLLREGLYYEARQELLAGIATAPEEPTLYLLLGRVYERVGLKDLAAEAFAEARLRSTRHP